MRNLKKILALVLALVMSLSLMATAGATDFKDDENISDTYRQAAQVLSELGVFNGDQNGQFNPEKPITRAEVAAILYRIATGDIGLEGNKTYAPYNQFPDVSAEDWYAGYVTYCANAGYIKGRNTGKFDARDNVTGYEVLAMILRAVGYDKNNEFVGSDWQLHTASIAREKGVLRNVLEDPNVKLSEPATREVVAELLFRASLLPQVTWNAATLSYVENGETLAMENLGMEQVEGVVIANEWADLRDETVTSADQTVLKTAEGERTLAVGTDLTDIGESRYAYVVGSKVLGQLENTGKNVTSDCVDLDPQGKGTTVGALANGLTTRDAEYFVNFSYGTKDTSEYRIEYSVSFRTEAAKEWFEDRYLGQTTNNPVDLVSLVAEDNKDAGRKASDVEYLNITGGYYQDAAGTPDSTNKLGYTFSRVIPAGDKITELDVAIMKGIFGSAASFDSEHKDFSELSTDIIHTGYVYAGTKSNPNTADRKDDLSDDYTYQRFADEYIGTDVTTSFNNTTNGVWLKVIDNNNDGAAEYVLATIYDLVEVESYNERNGAYYFSNGTDTDDYDYALRDGEYEFGVGDMLLMAWIDGQFVVEEAESEILIIDKYSWKDLNVTTRDGDVKYESGADIGNLTGYADRIADMQYGVEYEVFYDHYGFIRAYRLLDSDRRYGLLTDLYLTNYRNTHYINNQTATVELSFVDADGKLDMKEYDVANHNGQDTINPFVGVEQYVSTRRTDNLQRAIAHLALGCRTNAGSIFGYTPTVNNVTGYYANQSTVLGDEFDYDTNPVNEPNYDDDKNGTVDPDESIGFSKTNVARYTINEDGTVTLNTAAEYAYNKAGVQQFYWKNAAGTTDDFGATPITNGVIISNIGIGGTRATESEWRAAWAQSNGLTDNALNKTTIDAALAACLVPVYAVDYVMLDKTNNGATSIGGTTYRFRIDNSYNNGANLYNWHVNAVGDTVFYVVTDTGVYPFVGYKNLPTINTADITAMYAVAQNVTQDNASTDYWVANVIVIEVPSLGTAYGHMIYNVYDNYRQNQRGVIHEMNVIDCTTGELTTAVVDSTWNLPYDTGFYLLTGDETAEDGTITATGAMKVEAHKLANGTDYADYGIFAGEVVRSNEIESRASYIEVFNETTDVNVNGDEIRVDLNGAPWYSVHGTKAEAAKTAGRLTATQLADRDYSGNQPNGNEVIYVTYRGNVKFIIDTTFGSTNWVAPYYLNDLDRNYTTGTDVFDVAMNEQTGAPAGDGKIKFTANFSEYFDGTDVKTFPVPADIASFSTTTDGTGKTSTVVSLTTYLAGVPSGYTLQEVNSADSTKYTVAFDGTDQATVTAVGEFDLREGFTLNLVFDYDESSGANPPIKAAAKDGTFGVPAADWNVVGIFESDKASSKRTAGTDPQPGDMVDLFFTVKDSYKVESVTINAPTAIAGVYDTTMVMGKVDAGGTANPSGTFVKYYITFQLPAGVVDLTINVVNDGVNISVPENTTYTSDVVKDAALSGKTITLAAADANHSLPTSVTVKVGTRPLTLTDDYTYNNVSGAISFTANAGNADGDIVITGTAAVVTQTLTLTGADMASVVVKEKASGTVIEAERGVYKYTLNKGTQYTITITPKAKDGKYVSAVAGSSITGFVEDEETGTWSKDYTPAGDVTDTIGVSYTDTPVAAKVAIDLTGFAGAAVESVKQGGQDATLTSGKYSVMTGSEITVTLTPAAGKTVMGTPAATGVTSPTVAVESNGKVTVKFTLATADVDKTVAVTGKYFPASVTVAGESVTLTPAADRSKATGSVDITVGIDQFTDPGSSGTFTATVNVGEPDGTAAGGTYVVTASKGTLTSGTLTLTNSGSAPDAPVEVTLSVTFTPNP